MSGRRCARLCVSWGVDDVNVRSDRRGTGASYAHGTHWRMRWFAWSVSRHRISLGAICLGKVVCEPELRTSELWINSFALIGRLVGSCGVRNTSVCAMSTSVARLYVQSWIGVCLQ